MGKYVRNTIKCGYWLVLIAADLDLYQLRGSFASSMNSSPLHHFLTLFFGAKRIQRIKHFFMQSCVDSFFFISFVVSGMMMEKEKRRQKSFLFAKRSRKCNSEISDTSSLRSPGPFSCLGFVFALFFSDCFPFNFNFYYNFSFPLTFFSSPLLLAHCAVHLKWLMLPKIEINTRMRQKIANFCLRFPCAARRNIDAQWTPEDIAGVSQDHYKTLMSL